MPITYRIDSEHRIVLAEGRGTVTDRDVFGYQQEVWSRPDIAGFAELVDMTDVEHIALPSVGRIRDLATVSARMDPKHSSSKFAIVAPGGIAWVLGRMYQSYRELDRRSTKSVAVFRTREEAIAWLGVAIESSA